MIQILIGILQRSIELLLNLLPYVVIGVFLAEILKYTSWAEFVQKVIKKVPALSVVMASVLGIVSPLCTFGTIPVVMSLYKKRTPLAPLITFLSASTLINPQLFLITWGSFGFIFALTRLGSVFVFSLLLGYMFVVLEKRKSFNSTKINNEVEEYSRKTKNIKDFKIKEFLKSVWSTLKFIGFYLVLGVAISVTLEVIAPISLLFDRATMEWINIIIAAFVSIPVYICGGGVIPLVDMLMENGMSTGAAMAFLIVGPATRVTALTALGSFLSKKIIGFYVAALIIYSFILGLFLNLIFA